MGGSVSHEFLVPAPIGEDALWVNKSTGQAVKYEEGVNPPGEGWERQLAIELGHVFQLGTKYSESLGAVYLDEKGELKPMIMGCYGIGVSRLIAAIIEVNNDAGGIIWPREVAPFDVEILPVQASDGPSMSLARDYYDELQKAGLDVLLDDRDESPGRKFNDADLIGIPLRVIIGKRMLSNDQVEIKIRQSGQVIAVNKKDVKEEILKLWRP
jgi:prolyl-tRNA synthetase